MKRTVVSLAVGGAAVVGVATPASAQPQRGLVNVSIGDVTVLEDVGIGVAAQLAAQVCGLSVGPVAVLATEVARGGDPVTVCTTDQDEEVIIF